LYNEGILSEAEHLQLLLDCKEDHTLFRSKTSDVMARLGLEAMALARLSRAQA